MRAAHDDVCAVVEEAAPQGGVAAERIVGDVHVGRSRAVGEAAGRVAERGRDDVVGAATEDVGLVLLLGEREAGRRRALAGDTEVATVPLGLAVDDEVGLELHLAPAAEGVDAERAGGGGGGERVELDQRVVALARHEQHLGAPAVEHGARLGEVVRAVVKLAGRLALSILASGRPPTCLGSTGRSPVVASTSTVASLRPIPRAPSAWRAAKSRRPSGESTAV